MSEDLERLQLRLNHRFRQPALLLEAVTHTSFAADAPGSSNNQRLEFLGDAVLQIVLADALYRLFPQDREGLLSKRRSLLVNEGFLAGLAREVGLDACLRLGKSEIKTGGRARPSVLADAFEAIVGAMYLDADLPETRQLVAAIYGDLQSRLAPLEEADNPKGRLQELVHPVHGNSAIRYEVTAIEGQDHARAFEVSVSINDRSVARGRGLSKQAAEEEAARAALAILKNEPAREV